MSVYIFIEKLYNIDDAYIYMGFVTVSNLFCKQSL